MLLQHVYHNSCNLRDCFANATNWRFNETITRAAEQMTRPVIEMAQKDH